MSELIDRQAALDVLCDACGNCACPKGKIPRCSYYEKMKAIPAASPWHRVEEELPKQGEWVLVRSRFVRMMTDFIDKTGRWYRTPGVTHWMPLPEPPKEEEE